jgi:hypothetical protein
VTPEARPLPCPGCGGPTAANQSESDGDYWYRKCVACGGLLCAVPVFRRFVGNRRGQFLWASANADDAPVATGSCPFCNHAMRVAAAEHGRVWACFPCMMVWADGDALTSLSAAPPEHADQNQQRCPNCGAPVQRRWEHRCEYCGVALPPPSDAEAPGGGEEPEPLPSPTESIGGWSLGDIGESPKADVPVGEILRGFFRP